MKKKANSYLRNFFIFLFFLVVGIVVVGGVSWNPGDYNFYLSEDNPAFHTLSENISGFNEDIEFEILDTDTLKVYWTNSTGRNIVPKSIISPWISIIDIYAGNLSITSIHDYQTGLFEFNILAKNRTSEEANLKPFTITINATNDAPYFDPPLMGVYEFPQSEPDREYFFNASDEEEHYPLKFEIEFFDNCTYAPWITELSPENCSLKDNNWSFDFYGVSDTSAVMVFPNLSNDYVGRYWANVSVTETVRECENLPYCEQSYSDFNKTTWEIIEIRIEPILELDVSDCVVGENLTEGVEFNCTIYVMATTETAPITLSSDGLFVNPLYTPYSDRRDWFYPQTTNTSIDFYASFEVSVVPTKRDVGDWMITVTANDSLIPDGRQSEVITIFVDYLESNPSLESGRYEEIYYDSTNFNVMAYDDDLLVRDKSVKNENLTFSHNATGGWLTITNTSTPHSNNYSVATFSVNHSLVAELLGYGNVSVLINVSDDVGNLDSSVFTIFIGNNTAPEWNDSKSYHFVFYENETVSINLTGEEYVWDIDEHDTLTFSSSLLSGSLNNFNMDDDGVINHVLRKQDVGNHTIRISASDGKISIYRDFNFTINHINDAPEINRLLSGASYLGSTIIIDEGVRLDLSLFVRDRDFLIDPSQSNFYSEELAYNINFFNGSNLTEPLFYFTESSRDPIDNSNSFEIFYSASFTPNLSHVGVYNITINVTDKLNASDFNYFILDIRQVNLPPNLTMIPNFTKTIHESFYYQFNASDREEDMKNLEDRDLTYSITNIFGGDSFINSSNFNSSTGIVNVSNLSEFSGKWHYNVSVTDSGGKIDYRDFWISVYGALELNDPLEGFVFNLTENVTEYLEFNFSHNVRDNLTYELWTDFLSCEFQDNGNCNYSEISFRESGVFYGDGTLSNNSFTPDFTDETYGNLKNMTLVVYPNSSGLNESQRNSLKSNFSFGLNISHTNAPVEFLCDYIENRQATWDRSIDYDLSECFLDYDAIDPYYLQEINLSVSSNSSQSNVDVNGIRINFPEVNLSHNSWQISFSTSFRTNEFSERITLSASDIDNSTKNILTTIVGKNFTVMFTEPGKDVPTPTPSPSGGGGGSSSASEKEVLKHYSLKIITPLDVIISDENYIDIPFSIINNGQVDLFGISLSSVVSFNDQFTEDVKINLAESYLPQLMFGQAVNYTMRIVANTQRSGRYKATIYANVTSPKFEDWGDFFIDLRRVNETEAEQILIFTEKLVADNPECLELTEHLRRAQEYYIGGNSHEAILLARKVIESCEDSILANEQIRYKIEGFVQDNFFYILATTLAVFVIGFMLYIYKRVRFNKSKRNEYI